MGNKRSHQGFSTASFVDTFFECNCAPPTASIPTAPPQHLLSQEPPRRLQRVKDLIFVPLDDEHIACLSPSAPKSEVVVLHRQVLEFWRALPEGPLVMEAYPPSQRSLLLQLAHKGLLVDPEREKIFPIIANPTKAVGMNFWIEVTPRCNLDCPYCYVPKEGRAMRMEMAHRLLPEMLRYAAEQGVTKVQLTYAGGEPTLAWTRLWDIHVLARNLAQRYHLDLEPVLVTNGTLLNDQRLERLALEGFRIGFSLDGVDIHHDRHRAFQGRISTVGRVKEAILKARELGIPLRLINTITRMNLKGVPAFIAFAITHHLPFNLNFFRPRQWPHPLVPSAEALIATLRRAFRWIEAHLPPYRIIDGLLDRAFFGSPHLRVCSAGANYRAVNAAGRQAACPLLLGQGGADPTFQAPMVTQREPCASCIWRYWCGGGCPVIAQRAHGTPYAASPYCQVYQALYPELIRLEGLRVLRYGGEILQAPNPLPLAR